MIRRHNRDWEGSCPERVSSYGDLGRRTSPEYSGVAFASPSPPIGQTFGYNDCNELTASTCGTTTWGYEYDNIGNRETYDVTGQPTTTYTSNLLNQYAQTHVPTTPMPMRQTYEYDEDGSLTNVWLAGDMDCDRQITFGDVDAFTLALEGQAAYEAQYPWCNWLNGDINGDGTVRRGGKRKQKG